MSSMRTRLFLILIVATGIVWLSAAAWIYLNTRAEVERVLDARLTEAARMVSSLITSQDVDPKRAAQMPKGIAAPHPTYERQLSCQIWGLDGTLVGRSDGAPQSPLTNSTSGFSETVIDGETWRVYAIENGTLGMRILVGDNLRVRDSLVNDVIKGLLLPVSLIMPLLAGLIWLGLRKGFAPLNRMATALAARGASDLGPLPDDGAPSEIRPVVKALNDLFTRVAGARERERNFTAFAAHELKTPLAGLKTQAQIARASKDDKVREKALDQIALSANRTGRLVRQLLDIVSAEAAESRSGREMVNAGRALNALRQDLLAHSVQHAGIAISDALFTTEIAINPDLFALAARNLLENAILHSPAGGSVTCGLERENGDVIITIDDDGPGIPETELPQVTQRFFRGRHKTAVGSGLGLSIVELALHHAGAALSLRNRQAGGLSAGMIIPASRVRQDGNHAA